MVGNDQGYEHMSLFTSGQFSSAAASGSDWRDTSKAVLEKLDSVRETGSNKFNFGFLYIADYLSDDAASILNLFRSVLGIENWIGSIGMGVIGSGESFVDKPAISALVGHIPDDQFCIFPEISEDQGGNKGQKNIHEWLAHHTPMLAFVHGDPLADDNPAAILQELERTSGAFLVGGLSSSRSYHYQIANAVCENAVCGAFFDQTFPVVTTLSQGCEPIGDFHTVTKAHDNVILELDGRRALDVFQESMRSLAAKKLGKTIEGFVAELKSIHSSDDVPPEFKPLFRGQVHVALPFAQSDQNDFLVRDIMGIDADGGTFVISENIAAGSRLAFVERDEKTIVGDLSRNLVALRERVIAQYGVFQPKAGVYISCIARGYEPDGGKEHSEVNLIREIIGDMPLAGFYAGGEINNARIYGYTGVLILFL